MSEVSSTFYGDESIGSTVMEKNTRIISTIDMYAKLEVFCKTSGLQPNQVATNTWGYPYIPIPEEKTAYNHVRLAPKNVTPAFLGHPIYWINPRLTDRKDGESTQEWCIRMFYLIDAFGYWDEDLRWINFLEIMDFDFSDAQIKTYHKIADSALTDDYELLDKDDLDFPLENVDKHYAEAMKRCAKIFDDESVRLLHTQVKHFRFAREVLGDTIRQWDAAYDSPGSLWAREFYPSLAEIAQEYNDRAQKGDTIVSDLRKKALHTFDVLTEMIEKIHQSASILELPVKAIADGNPGGPARVSYMAAAMSLAASRDNLRKQAFEHIDKEITYSFTSGSRGEGGFDNVIEQMAQHYGKAWNRLRLAFINYQNLQRGEPVFSTAMELNASLAGGNTSEELENQFNAMQEWEEGLK